MDGGYTRLRPPATLGAMSGHASVSPIPPSAYRARRAAVQEALGDGVMVLPAAPVLLRSRDTEHRYRADSELFYLTGATAPGTVAVLTGGAEPRFVLFAPDRDADAELWTGPRPDPEEVGETMGADEAHPASRLDTVLPGLLAAHGTIHVRLGRRDRIGELVLEALERARTHGQRKGSGPRGVVDPGQILDELRLVKDAHELERIRTAVEITLQGHRAGAGKVAPGAGEWEVEAAVDGTFRSAGAAGPAFATIVGAGPNACVLHYVENGSTLAEDDLVLVDAGAEVGLYAGDVTRTLPASGRLEGRARAVYEVVETAREAAIGAVHPGATVADVHGAAVGRLVDGLLELGVLEGAPEALAEAQAHKRFFPHQTSHWLGLDVHDPGDYARGGEARPLVAGMTLTVEPGLYFRPGLCEDGAERFEGIGVRLEDDVLVTEDGCEVLSAGLPTAPDDVEALMAEAREERGG